MRGILALALLATLGEAALGQQTVPNASQNASQALTREVRELLAEPSQEYPDVWEPRRQRPRRFFVIPGEDLTYEERLTAMALVGLVNRDGPKLFIRGHFGFNLDADRFWLNRLAEEYGMPSAEIGLDEALKEFRSSVLGGVVCDDKLPASETVALSLAGTLRLLPALGSMSRRLEEASIPTVLDLRDVWSDHVTAQAWTLDVLGGVHNDQLIGFLSVRTKALWGIADYLVMHGAPVFDLSSDEAKYPEEYALRDRALARLKQGSIVWGWVCHDSESQHVAHASIHGHRVLCSTNCPNLSFLSRVRPKLEHYRQKSPAPRSRPIEKKLYLTFVLTDGDSIPILLTRQWYRWDDPARGKVPFGWEHQPLLADLAPVVFEYYYETMTPLDRFICGPSGAGYVHPGKLPNLDWFVQETGEFLRRTDLHCVGVCADWDEEAAGVLSRGTAESVGFFHGWGEDPNRPLLMAHGKPYLHYWLCPATPDESERKTKDADYFAREAAKIRRIVARQGMPCFVAAHLSCYWNTPSDVLKLLEALGDDVPHEILLPDQFLQMIGDHYGDRIVVEPVECVQLMSGVATDLTLRLTSTRSQPTTCRIQLVPPAGATVDPEDITVQFDPFGHSRITATLKSVSPADERQLAVRLAFNGNTGLSDIPVRHVPPVEGQRDGLTLCSVWEAESLSHNTGEQAEDAEAHNGQAWRAIPGRHQAGTHAVWGPYEELPPGRYAAVFRVKVDRKATVPVARFDVYNFWLAEAGKTGLRAERIFKGSDLAAAGHYQDVWLDFERTETGKVEYRVFWPGGAGLSVDRIVVLRYE